MLAGIEKISREVRSAVTTTSGRGLAMGGTGSAVGLGREPKANTRARGRAVSEEGARRRCKSERLPAPGWSGLGCMEWWLVARDQTTGDLNPAFAKGSWILESAGEDLPLLPFARKFFHAAPRAVGANERQTGEMF
jgi:hypothetical protein